MRTLTEKEACVKHEECRQAFITEITYYHLVEELPEARWALVRANAAVAQGMIWADLIGIDPAGWLSRMQEITQEWDKINPTNSPPVKTFPIP